MKNIFFLPLLLVIFIAACGPENSPTPESSRPQYKMASALFPNDVQLNVYADTNVLFTGYNPLYFEFIDDFGETVSDATVKLLPEMDMGMHQHGCPVDLPVYQETEKWYKGAAVFTMPSTAGAWQLKLVLNEDTLSLPITVKEFPTAIVQTFMTVAGERYVLSLIRPQQWKVGLNTVSFTLHQMNSPFQFIPVNDAEMEMDPEMPSMGHGSPNNVPPVSVGNGHYQGQVNFTMTGDWRLHLTIQRDGEVLSDEVAIDIVF